MFNITGLLFVLSTVLEITSYWLGNFIFLFIRCQVFLFFFFIVYILFSPVNLIQDQNRKTFILNLFHQGFFFILQSSTAFVWFFFVKIQSAKAKNHSVTVINGLSHVLLNDVNVITTRQVHMSE